MSKKKYDIKVLTICVLIISFAFSTVGCSVEEEYVTSKRVSGLWDKYPEPWYGEQFEQATSEAYSLLKKHPEDFQLAKYYLMLMERPAPDLISEQFAEISQKRKNDPRWMILNSYVNGNFDNYFAQVNNAYRSEPNDPYVIAEFIRLLLKRGGNEEIVKRATDEAFRLYDIAPELPIANARLAFMLFEHKQFDKADPLTSEAIRLAPWDYQYSELRAVLLDATDRRSDGTIVLEQYNNLYPGNPDCMNILLQRYREDEQWRKMVPIKKMQAELNSADGMSWLELAMLFNQTDEIDSTFYYLDVAIKDGFFDENFFRFSFNESITKLEKNDKYHTFIGNLAEKRAATADRRQQMAIANPLNIPVPNLEAFNMSGDPVHLNDGLGRVVVLYFWSTWSGWCHVARPQLEAFNDQTGVETVVVGINVKESNPMESRIPVVQSYVREQKYSWPNWIAEDSVADDFAVSVLPSYVVIDPDGIIRYQLDGYIPFLDEVLLWQVDAAGGMSIE
jgi:thiol-disulfide isomerase/thioredoxin